MSEQKLEPTIGLEIHIELDTKTKMFCGCKNDPFNSQPNTNVCPVCYGLPGALPLLNKSAIEYVVKLGKALDGEVSKTTLWARKNYFYPDLPKGYQISQLDLPLVNKAKMTIDNIDYRITRIHLEEDAGKLTHDPGNDQSLVDFNRAGVPLLELVTEPDFHSSESAKRFCQELQRIVRHLKISTADMEKGQMRCEANISIAKPGEKLGTKVEVKNINSFRAVAKSIEYEITRQTEIIEKNQKVVQETRGWNDGQNKTITMRIKETSADYRYFPEPDLPVVKIGEIVVEGSDLPEKRRQILLDLGLNTHQATVLVDKNLDSLVNQIAEIKKELTVEAGKWLIDISDLASLKPDQIVIILEKRLEHGWTKEIFKQVIEKVKSGQDIKLIAADFAGSDDIGAEIDAVVKNNPKAVEDFRQGKEASFNFLVGQVMAVTKGKANINTVREQLEKTLKS